LTTPYLGEVAGQVLLSRSAISPYLFFTCLGFLDLVDLHTHIVEGCIWFVDSLLDRVDGVVGQRLVSTSEVVTGRHQVYSPVASIGAIDYDSINTKRRCDRCSKQWM